MNGHLGFSYVGLLFLSALFIPNIIWTKNLPQGYTSENENKILLAFERLGEVLTCCCALIFSDFNLHKWTVWRRIHTDATAAWPVLSRGQYAKAPMPRTGLRTS